MFDVPELMFVVDDGHGRRRSWVADDAAKVRIARMDDRFRYLNC